MSADYEALMVHAEDWHTGYVIPVNEELDQLLDQIRAEAWDEGSAAGWHDAMRYEASGRGECEWAGLIKNPYRPEGEEQ